MESSNPALNSKIFDNARVAVGGQTMTIQGTINKSFILLAIMVATAAWAWSMSDPANAGMIQGLFWVGLIGGLVLAIASTIKPAWTPVTAPLYAAFEGLVLGFISVFYEARFPGIAMQGVGLSFAVLMAMLMGYKAGWLQATPGLRKGLMIAGGAVFLFYLVVMGAGFFGIAPPGFLFGSGPLGIAFSLVVVGIASMFLILDFDFIERAAAQGLNKYMEWYGAFGLMVTLVWMYLEILRLLSKLRR